MKQGILNRLKGYLFVPVLLVSATACTGGESSNVSPSSTPESEVTAPASNPEPVSGTNPDAPATGSSTPSTGSGTSTGGSPAPSPTTSTPPSGEPSPQPQPEDPVPASLSELYDRLPDISRCDPGVLKSAERNKVLAKLNEVRRLHGLREVVYESGNDTPASQAALIIVANEKLTHTPDSSMMCWTQEGARGSERSNLGIRMAQGNLPLQRSSDSIASFLIDADVASLGHRRWLLDPFLTHVALGRVDGKSLVAGSRWDRVTGVALQVINDTQASVAEAANGYVAYPVGDYPASLFQTDWYLSFSVLADAKNKANNRNVDYSAARISMSAENGTALTVHSVGYDTNGYGLPNVLKWKADKLASGVRYTVRIDNVSVQGAVRNYSYQLRLQ